MRTESRSLTAQAVQNSEARLPETGKIEAPVLRRSRESGGPLDPCLRGDDRQTLKRLAFRCGLLLTSVFWILTPAFAGTHVTGTYSLGTNPSVMATVNGTPEYGLVFVQRNKSVNYGGVQYGPQVLNGYLDVNGNLNDGAGNLWLDLIPNTTASPSDSYFVVTVNIQGNVHSEIWVVPDVSTIDAASVRQAQPPTSTPPSAFYQFVQQSGTNLTQRPALNFTGTGVSCADNSAALSTDCTVTAGTGGSGSAPIASATVSGTVKTDSTVGDPVVYLTGTADSLLAAKANSVHTHAESDVTNLVSDLAAKVPTSRLVSTTAPLAGGGSLASNLTLSIPAASGAQNGYLSSGDWSAFNSKESALTFSTPLSRSVNTISCPTCEITGNKNAASGYAGLTASSKLTASQGQEVWALADLTNVSGTSGSGSTAILSTISAPADAQCLTWSAGSSNWVNGSCAGGSSNHNLLSATHPDTVAASPVLGDVLYAISTPAWTKLTGNTTTTKKFLTQTGTGSASAAPVWNTIAAADVPSLDAAKITTGTFADAFLASAYSGVGSCTNQAVTALTRNAAPTCSTVTSAMTSGTFAPSAHNLLSSSHGDTTAGTVARGDVITGQTATPKWQRLALATAGKYLKSDGTDLVYSTGAASGTGACAANSWASTLNADAVPNCTQPAFSNLSGSATNAQLPAAFDISGKTSTAPVKAGTSAGAPGTCTANKELYIKTDVTAGQQLFICNSAGNGWNLVGDGGGAGGGITSINSDSTAAQSLSVGTSGTDVNISDGGSGAHMINVPSASATARGVVNTTAQTFLGNKTFSNNLAINTSVPGAEGSTYQALWLPSQAGIFGEQDSAAATWAATIFGNNLCNSSNTTSSVWTFCTSSRPAWLFQLGSGTSTDFWQIQRSPSGTFGLVTLWKVTSAGHFITGTDNTQDIGASGSTRPRTGYFGTSIVTPTVNATTGFQVNGAATTATYLRGNGTNFVSAAIVGTDLPAANRTLERSINIFSPTTSDTNKVQIYFGQAVTITRVACSTDVGTVDIQFDKRAEATPNTAGTNALTATLQCTTTSGTTASFSSASVAADVPLNLQISATASTPGVVRIHVKATID
jgi:hypothetical protein